MELSKVELVRQALSELGEASSQDVATFIQQRQGVRIEPRFIPVLRVSVRGQQLREQARQSSSAADLAAENPGSDSEKTDVPAAIPPSGLGQSWISRSSCQADR